LLVPFSLTLGEDGVHSQSASPCFPFSLITH
jgi:hypothetical protein